MNPILRTLLEKVEAMSAKIADLALNFERLRADFANHLTKSADRDRLINEHLATNPKILNPSPPTPNSLLNGKSPHASQIDSWHQPNAIIKWFVGIAFALFLANATAVALLLEYRGTATTNHYYQQPPAAVYYAPPASSIQPDPN